MSVANNLNSRERILSCEQMVAKALSEVSHRKALSEIEIFQYIRRHFHNQIGTDYTQIRQDVKQELKRATVLGTIEEVKGFGSWSLYRIADRKQKKHSSVEEIKDYTYQTIKPNCPNKTGEQMPKKVLSPYSLRTPVVRTPHPSLSQFQSLRRSKFKALIWKKLIPECTPVTTPARFEVPFSATSPAYIKFKQIGAQNTCTVSSVARLHHRKIAAEHPAYEEMVEKILTEFGKRKTLSEADIFKYLVLRFRVASNYAKIKTDLKQAIRRCVIFGTIKEVKGYGQWSTYQIAEKENDYRSAVSVKHMRAPIMTSQNLLSVCALQTSSGLKNQITTPIWKKDTRGSLDDSMPSSSSQSSSFFDSSHFCI